MAKLTAREKGLLAAALGMVWALSESDANPDQQGVRREMRRLAAKLGVGAEVRSMMPIYRSFWGLRLAKPEGDGDGAGDV